MRDPSASEPGSYGDGDKVLVFRPVIDNRISDNCPAVDGDKKRFRVRVCELVDEVVWERVFERLFFELVDEPKVFGPYGSYLDFSGFLAALARAVATLSLPIASM